MMRSAIPSDPNLSARYPTSGAPTTIPNMVIADIRDWPTATSDGFIPGSSKGMVRIAAKGAQATKPTTKASTGNAHAGIGEIRAK